MHALIELTQGKFTKVDASDLPLLSGRKWHATSRKKGCSKSYAETCQWNPATRKISGFLMHRLLLDAPKGVHVDHINGDGLDNRRCNLRLVTPRQNSYNKRPSDGTNYARVVKVATGWRARIDPNGGTITLGVWESQEKAAGAYNRAAEIIFGEFAYLNPVERLSDKDWQSLIDAKQKNIDRLVNELNLLKGNAP